MSALLGKTSPALLPIAIGTGLVNKDSGPFGRPAPLGKNEGPSKQAVERMDQR